MGLPAGIYSTDGAVDHKMWVQQLFVRHQSVLKGFILSLQPDFTEADDILQEVFLVVTQKVDSFVVGTNFLAWARQIARQGLRVDCG